MHKPQITFFILILTIFLAACTNSQAKEIQNTPIQILDLAFIEDISVSQISTDEITLIAHGQLPDLCTKIEKSDIEHADGAIIVSVFTSRAMITDCGSDPVDFDQEIIIDLTNSPGFSNTIIVNGISTRIEVPERENSSVDIISTPSPTPDSQASVSEEVKENDQDNTQDNSLDNPPDTQTVQTATEVPQPTKVTDVANEESTNEAEPTQSIEGAQPTSLPSEPEPQTAQCIDKAAFYADVTVPDNTVFKPGDKFEKVWRIRNEGTCTWNAGYALIFASGEIMNGALSNPLPEVAPGEIAEISIDLQAPARWGQYGGNWQFQNNRGVRFGVGAGGHDFIWVQIFVDSPAPAPPSNPQAELPSDSPSDQAAQPPQQSTTGCAAQRNDSFEQQVLGLINNARSSQGLNTLMLQSQLSNAAYTHSSDMACQDFIGHSGSDASSWYDRVSAQGYANFNSARENIYVGDPQFGGTPDGAFEWWMNSQVHRDNILNPDVDEIGIGYSYYPNSSYGGYYTVVFARP